MGRINRGDGDGGDPARSPSGHASFRWPNRSKGGVPARNLPMLARPHSSIIRLAYRIKVLTAEHSLQKCDVPRTFGSHSLKEEIARSRIHFDAVRFQRPTKRQTVESLPSQGQGQA